MTQTNKCKLFDHSPDLTTVKTIDPSNVHTCLCINCGLTLTILVQDYLLDDIWEAGHGWYNAGDILYDSKQ